MHKSFLFRFLILFAAVFGVIFLFVWFYLSVTQPADAAELPPPAGEQAVRFETGRVQIRTRSGHGYAFDVEIATTQPQQRLGLMHRDSLAADAGMLFVYDPPRRIAMWMKNTKISLDMVFAGRSGTIFYIHENAQPMSEDLIPSPADTAYVLELPAGTARRLGIQTGDKLLR